MLRQGMFTFILAASAIGVQTAHAFPEMVRHGYANCIACHVSPNGGGVLTEYGRELSKEVLSTWGADGEQRFLYAVKPPEGLSLGGDIRALQLYQNTPDIKMARWIWMQSDAEAAATVKKFIFDATAGYREVPVTGGNVRREYVSRRFFVNYRPTDEISVRAGRFLPEFGINTPEHNLVIRNALGWNISSDVTGETNNLEIAWLGEKLNGFLTWVAGRDDKPELDREKGVSASGSVFLGEGYKLGLSYYYGANSQQTRHVFGPHGILGFSKKFFLLSQLDYETSAAKNQPSASTVGKAVSYHRLNYEWVQGFHIYCSHQFSQTDLNNGRTAFKGYGLGLQFFPRPHLDIQAFWEKQAMAFTNQDDIDFAYLLFHYYL